MATKSISVQDRTGEITAVVPWARCYRLSDMSETDQYNARQCEGMSDLDPANAIRLSKTQEGDEILLQLGEQGIDSRIWAHMKVVW